MFNPAFLLVIHIILSFLIYPIMEGVSSEDTSTETEVTTEMTAVSWWPPTVRLASLLPEGHALLATGPTNCEKLTSAWCPSLCFTTSHLAYKFFHSLHCMVGLEERQHSHKALIFLSWIAIPIFARILKQKNKTKWSAKALWSTDWSVNYEARNVSLCTNARRLTTKIVCLASCSTDVLWLAVTEYNVVQEAAFAMVGERAKEREWQTIAVSCCVSQYVSEKN